MSTMAIKERPILFSGEMVRAILDGRKQQTRRIVKPQPAGLWGSTGKVYGHTFAGVLDGPKDHYWVCKFGQPGDRLWVRETWAPMCDFDKEFGTLYRADSYPSDSAIPLQWKPSIHMPRAASRITLEITGVRVEQLNDISEEDAISEGWPGTSKMPWSPRGWFQSLWQSINGEDSWDANPWVWVIEFKRVTDAAQTSARGNHV